MHDGHETSYAALAQLAERVSARLGAAGVGPGDLVGLRMDAGPALLAAMLGVLRTGAAYVPINRDDPDERVRHIVADACMATLLTSPGRDLPAYAGAPAVIVVDAASLGVDTPGAPPSAATGDLAYVIYTSGSTGLPKGVAMGHGSLVNLLLWHDRARPGSCRRRTLQACSVGFDFSFHEIFSTLCFGGQLVVAGDAVRGNPFALARFVSDAAIERVFLPVTVLNQLAEAADEDQRPLALAEVITTGERLRPTPALRRLFARCGARLHNHYGATEFQDATTFTLDGNPEAWPTLVPVGWPIDNVTVHVLDERLRRVADGEAGELYVGGAGVARGYLRRPELTAERFVTDPSGGGRMYRTGDLARVGAAGALELLGRADDQVKIHGVRVELAEIEALLTRHPAVRDAAVLADAEGGADRLVAYVVGRHGTPGVQRDALELRGQLHAYLARYVPAAVLPESYVLLDTMPLTPSGKTDRRVLLRAKPQPPPSAPKRSTAEVEGVLTEIWREVLQVDAVGADENFFDAGGTSLRIAEVRRLVAERLGTSTPVTAFFRYSTIRRMALHLTAAHEPADGKRQVRRREPAAGGSSVAIVGMACRFPGADDLDAFWRNLATGAESLTRFSDSDLAQPDAALRDDPRYVRAGAVLTGIDGFDAAFFNFSSREAALMDPQHRVFLECAWEAFEDAGYDPAACGGRVGVFAGGAMSTYLVNNLNPHFGFDAARPLIEADMLQFQLKLGNDRSYLPTRVSYKLDLRGPSVNVQSACSTSLVAVHLACGSLLNGECELALAGGVSIIVPDHGGYLFEEGMVRSPDGHSRAFDARAAGTMFGNGSGAVLLKRLDDALADGDRIAAVVRGSAVNNDGAPKVGFTAPNLDRQAEVIEDALAAAGVDAATIGYVEAHGTGTALGDPIEIAALTQGFARASDRATTPGSCALGSVKTNIGHLDEAAGIAGLIKTTLALGHGAIPPSLHFDVPHPEIDFDAGPFYVNTALRDWREGDVTRRAGVSSFGMGGTNCHLVLEQAPDRMPLDRPSAAASTHEELLVLSARSKQALRDLTGGYLERLDASPPPSLADLCASAANGRRHLEYRLAVVADSIGAARDELTRSLDVPAIRMIASPRVAFVFGGQGSQYAGMGRELYERRPVFREGLDRCDALLRPHLQRPLLEILFPREGETSAVGDTAHAQPALFAVEWALSEQWRAWGVEPDVVIGHSVGEYVAACVAGVFSLEDGLRLVASRGRLMQALPRDGRMVAVAASEAVVEELVLTYDDVAIAAVNGPGSTVISGRAESVGAICEALRARGTTLRDLDVSHAFHSPSMDPILAAFSEVACSVTYSEPRIAIVSNVAGEGAGPEIARADHWVEHVRRPVRFAAGMDALGRDGATVLVEISPRPTLLQLAGDAPGGRRRVLAPSMRPGRESAQLLRALGDVHASGVAIDWSAVYDPRVHERIRLPGYPWQRQRHWVDSAAGTAAREPAVAPSGGGHPLCGPAIDLAGSDERRFESVVSASRPGWLADHRVYDTVVMPGVAFLEMALHAGHDTCGDGPLAVEDLVIHRALEFERDGTARALQTVLRPADSGVRELDVYSRAAEGSWTRHASARIAPGRPVEQVVGLPDLRARFTEEVPVAAIYEGELEREIDLGPSFWATRRLWRDGTSCLSQIAIPAALASEGAAYRLHPIVLEACLLALTVTYPERYGRRTYVPVGFDRVSASGAGIVEGWCHVRLRPAEAEDPDVLHADCELLSEDGRAVLEFEGIVLKRAGRASMLGGLQPAWPRWLYETRWEERARDPQRSRPERLLILSDGVLGPAIAAAARAAGGDCVVVEPGVSSDPVAAPDGAVVVVDCRALASTDQTPDRAALSHCTRLLSLVGSLGAHTRDVPRLIVVTRGAQPADGPVSDPAQAALAGLARVVAVEHPELRCLHVDLGAVDDAATQAHDLLEEIAAVTGDGPGDAVALRGGVRRVARLAGVQAGPPPQLPSPVTGDGTYLVTGGLGALGLEVAHVLVSLGARRLALVGRDSPSLAARAAIGELEGQGARVAVFAADVADAGQLAGVLDAIAADSALRPLRGVLHLAGVLDDGVLRRQTPDRFAAVMAPKATGASLLHELTAGLDLRLFVLFSSSSSLLGSAGQGSYAAANAFLDGLASLRRAAGLPAQSIQWGSWADKGMSAGAGAKTRAARTREGAIDAADARAALARFLQAPPAADVVAVLPTDWPRFLATPAGAAPLFSGLGRGVASSVLSPTRLSVRLDAAPPERRRALVEAHVREQLAAVLGDDIVLTPHAGFFSLGMDSLASIELRNALQTSLGRPIGQTVAFDHPNLVSLVAHLCDDVLGLEKPVTSGVGAAERLAAKLGIEGFPRG